jgi:2-dehydro-3-deoxygluconokinase
VVDVVTFGESLALFQSALGDPLAHAPLFTRGAAGAESNVAIGLARLGKRTRWVSRLGADPLGDAVLSAIRGEGVEVIVARDPDAPTGLMFREARVSEPVTYYHRAHSAASRLSSADLPSNLLIDARWLHVTGITPALSSSAREASLEAMHTARSLGLTVSFDPNLRRKLWGAKDARATLLEMLKRCDVFLPGLEEARFLLNAANDASPRDLATAFLECGVKVVALKLGVRGAMVLTAEHTFTANAIVLERTLDPIGAGDAFAAGFISRLLDETEPLDASADTLRGALERGNRLGALATQFKGDWEGLPRLADLERLEREELEVTR